MKWETWSKAQQEAGLRCCYEGCFSPLSLLPSAAFVPLEGGLQSQQLTSTASAVAWQRRVCSHSSLIMQTLLDCSGPLAISAPIIVGSGSGLHMLPGIQCLTWTTQTENKREAGVTDGPHEWHGYRANAGLPKQRTKHTLGFLEVALC